MIPEPTEALDLGALQGVIERRASELGASGRWSVADETVLNDQFEEAVRRALRVPRFAERSRRLRTLARRLVPEPARPAVKSAARLAERLVRGAHRRTLGRR